MTMRIMLPAGAGATRFLACALLSVLLALASAACSSGDDDGADEILGPAPPLEASRQFRALAGVSMGGYGAMNLATKRSDLFGVIASLGGPVDMKVLLRDIIADNLEVRSQTQIPRDVGDDFTFDHLAPYPDRDTRVTMIQDLVIAFGNPFLHHPDESRRYLASDSQPAMLLQDDRYGSFELVDDPRGFLDGGDDNQDGLRQRGEIPSYPTDVLLLAGGSLASLTDSGSGELVGGRSLADLDGDGIFDVGDGIVVNFSEPFTDLDGDGVFEPDDGETFDDFGLDGVPGSGDFGEGNGQFDYDPDRARWVAEDPLSRIEQRSAAAISEQRIYMDVGTDDEFGFAAHYANFVDALVGKGLSVGVQDGFRGNCANLPDPDDDYLLVRYAAGHIGVETVDPDDLLDGNICGDATVWQRVINMVGFLNESFPNGSYGPGIGFDIDIDFDDFDFDFDFPDPNVSGQMISTSLPSPSLAVAGQSAPMRDVLVYRPPAFRHTDDHFPVVYLLPGYGQSPGDFSRMEILLDALILSGQLQNMFIVILPGDGGRRGSFYVNHSIPESAVPDHEDVTSGRYEDSIMIDLIPTIEHEVLRNRVRRGS